MRQHHSLKPRASTNWVQTGVGGLRSILQGAFGLGSPSSQLSQEVMGTRTAVDTYFEADLFTPGTGNWVRDPSLETPLQTNWGHAFLRNSNVFAPFAPQTVYTLPHLVTVGIGGQVSGQIISQPLTDPNSLFGE